MTTDEFLKLQRIWDEKLKRRGFEDIEKRSMDGRGPGRLTGMSRCDAAHWKKFTAGAENMSRLRTFRADAHDCWFEKGDRHILRMFTLGMTLEQIAKAMSAIEKKRRGKHYVFRRIRRIKNAAERWWVRHGHEYEGEEAPEPIIVMALEDSEE